MQNGTVHSQGTVPTYEYSQHQPLHSPYHHSNGHFLQPLSPGYLMAQGSSPLHPTLIHSPVVFKQEQFSPMQASLASVHAQQSHMSAPNGMQHSPKMAKLSPYSQNQLSPQICYSNCSSPMQPQQPAAMNGLSSLGDLSQQHMHHIHTIPPSQGLAVHAHHPNHPPPQYKELFQPKQAPAPYAGLQPQYQHSAAGFHYLGTSATTSLAQDYSLTHMSAPTSLVYHSPSPGMPLR